MKNFRNMAIILLVVFTTVILALGIYCKVNMTGTSNSDTKKIVNIEKGSIDSIAKTLKDNNLIKNVSIFKVYIKLTNKTSLKAGTYELSENMGVEKIVKILEEGTKYNPNEISITFKEGINIRKIATLISENTNNSYDDVIKKASDETFIDTLINKYWFLTDDIKNENIYYALEGYLFPETYSFSNGVDVKIILETMLDQTDKVFSKQKSLIDSSSYSIHEIATIASMIEKEGKLDEDRKYISSVFYNRLKAGMSLGSDVTTYYAFKIEVGERDLTSSELNTYNPYNTRGPKMAGKLPVGPISNYGEASFIAALNPADSNYYYFVADKSGKTHFTRTYEEHQKVIKELKQANNWIEW